MQSFPNKNNKKVHIFIKNNNKLYLCKENNCYNIPFIEIESYKNINETIKEKIKEKYKIEIKNILPLTFLIDNEEIELYFISYSKNINNKFIPFNLNSVPENLSHTTEEIIKFIKDIEF